MNEKTGRIQTGYSGWIIIGIIIFLFISTIFVGQFFKSEEKIKLAFENGQTLSFFTAAYNDKKEIIGAFVFFFQPKTNICGVLSILSETFINFGEKHGYLTLKESLEKKVSYEEILNAVSNLIGHKINYYIFVKDENIVKIIDMTGGVELYSDGIQNPSKNVFISSGVTLLDGEKSLEYLSFDLEDEGNHEYDHLKRVETFIRGFIKLKPDFFEQITEKTIANYIYKLVTTNMSINEVFILHNSLFKRYQDGILDYSKGLNTLILYCDKKKVAGYDYVYMPKKSGEWVKSEVSEMVIDIEKSSDSEDIKNIVIEVLNGTDITGLATRARNYLIGFGFDVFEVGNAENQDYTNTIVIVHNNERKARKLAELINCDKIVIEENDNSTVDATIILGYDFDGRVVR